MTKLEKAKLIAKVIEISIKVINENHVYKFNGKIYKQGKGGATGLRLTGLLARVAMDQWSRIMNTKMEDNIIKTY